MIGIENIFIEKKLARDKGLSMIYLFKRLL
jgi:hypothetical protein